MQEIRLMPLADMYDETVRQLANANERSWLEDGALVSYRLPQSGEHYSEPLIVEGISETRGQEEHQLVVRDLDDEDHQLFTIPLYRLERIDPL